MVRTTLRYTYNGKQLDLELGWQAYGKREYLGGETPVFTTPDPLISRYPMLTPYQFASNTPIWATDLDGLEANFSSATGTKVKYENLSGNKWVNLMANKDAFWGNVGISAWNQTVGTAEDLTNIAFSSKGRTQVALKMGNALMSMVDVYAKVQEGQMSYTQLLQMGKQYLSDPANLEDLAGGFLAGWLLDKGIGIVGDLKVKFTSSLTKQVAKVSELKLTAFGEKLAANSGKKPYIISAVTDTKSGETFFGANKGIKSLDDVEPELRARLPQKTLEQWATFNCAECDAYNQALKAGSKWENLGDLHTKQWDNTTKKYIDVERCDNCKVTFKDKNQQVKKNSINSFENISIRGRFIYGYLCLMAEINHCSLSKLPLEIDSLYHEFVSSNMLDVWHGKVEDILPSFILHVEEVNNDYFPTDVVKRIKQYYKEQPLFIVETIENLFWLGISNLYVAYNSGNSLKYLKLIIEKMYEQSIIFPDFEKIERCLKSQKNGWGEYDNLDNYVV